MVSPASVGGKPTKKVPPVNLSQQEPPQASRWQLRVSGVLLLLWILFLAWIALAG